MAGSIIPDAICILNWSSLAGKAQVVSVVQQDRLRGKRDYASVLVFLKSLCFRLVRLWPTCKSDFSLSLKTCPWTHTGQRDSRAISTPKVGEHSLYWSVQELFHTEIFTELL